MADASSRRAESARATRHRILETARTLLASDGYAAMTVTKLAAAAGVSPQTIYNSIGGKAEVVKALYDIVLAGDTEETPMSARPDFRVVTTARSPASWAAAYAAWSRRINERTGPFLAVLLAHGPAGDTTLREFLATTDRERRQGNRMSISGKIADRIPEQLRETVVDSIWVLTAPDIFAKLTGRCGWTPADYEAWLADQLTTAIQRGR
jgi:AcrR family transcriptional regulator